MSAARNDHVKYTTTGPRPLPSTSFHYSSIFHNSTSHSLSYWQCSYIHSKQNSAMSGGGREEQRNWLISTLSQYINTLSAEIQLGLSISICACVVLPTKQLYVLYVLHQQVHFVSHVTREDNLWRRVGSAATQRLACYTRRRELAGQRFWNF